MRRVLPYFLEALLGGSPFVQIALSVSHKACDLASDANVRQTAVCDSGNLFRASPNVEISLAVNSAVWLTSRYLADILQADHLFKAFKLSGLKNFTRVKQD